MFHQLASISAAVTVLLSAAPAVSVPVSKHHEVLEDFGTYAGTYAPTDTYQEEVYEYVTTAPPGVSTTSSSGMATLAPYTTTISVEATTLSGCYCPPMAETGEVTVAPATMTSTLPTTTPEGAEGASSVTTTTVSSSEAIGEDGSYGTVATTTATTTSAGIGSTTEAMYSETLTVSTAAPFSEDTEVRVGARISSQPPACSCPTNGTVLIGVNAGGGEVFADYGHGSQVTDTSASAAESEGLNQFWMPMDVDIVNMADMDQALEAKGYFLRSHVSGKSFQYSVSFLGFKRHESERF